MKITKQLVAALRERTGAGLNACYKALQAVNGNIEGAIEELKKTGQKLAATKVHRATNEGMIITRVSENAQKAVILKLTCETDFVAKNEIFQNFAHTLVDQSIKHNTTTLEALLSTQMTEGQTVEQERQSIVARLGENIQISEFQWLETAYCIGTYTHKGQYGALVELKRANDNIAKEIAIHIVVNQPSDTTKLLRQEFYKDPSQTVAQYLSKQDAEVMQFILFKL